MTMLEARDYSDAFPFDLDYEVPEKVKNPLWGGGGNQQFYFVYNDI